VYDLLNEEGKDMSLADKLKNAALERTKPDNYCAYQFMYDNLSPENKKALDDAWTKGYSANIILTALRSEGIKSSNESIRAHRNGLCKCKNK
jgi:hypothetical protein